MVKVWWVYVGGSWQHKRIVPGDSLARVSESDDLSKALQDHQLSSGQGSKATKFSDTEVTTPPLRQSFLHNTHLKTKPHF